MKKRLGMASLKKTYFIIP